MFHFIEKEIMWNSGSQWLEKFLLIYSRRQKQQGIFPPVFNVIATVMGFRLCSMWNLSFIQSTQTTNALQGILYSIHFPIKSVVSNQTPIVSRESEIDTIITLIQSCQSSYICTSSFSSLRIYGFQWILSCLFQFLESNSGNHRFLKLLVYVILKRFQIFTFSTWHLILWKMSFTVHWKLILPSSDVYYLFLFKVPSEAYATL